MYPMAYYVHSLQTVSKLRPRIMSSAVKRLVPITALNTEQTFVEYLLMNLLLARKGFLVNGKAETHVQVADHIRAVRNTHILGGQERGDGDMKGTMEEVMLERGGWIRRIKKLSTVGRQGWAGRGQNLEKTGQK